MKEILKALNMRPVAYYPAYVDITGSLEAGVLLSQIMYWWSAMDCQEFFKTDDEFCKELRLTPAEFKAAKKRLKESGLVNIRPKGVPARTHYLVDETAIQTSLVNLTKLDKTEVLEPEIEPDSREDKEPNLPNYFGEIHQTTSGNFAELLGANSPNYSGEKAQTITESNTEITKKTTTEIFSSPKGKAKKSKAVQRKPKNPEGTNDVWQMFQIWAGIYTKKTGTDIFPVQVDNEGQTYFDGLSGKYAMHLKAWKDWFEKLSDQREVLQAWGEYLGAAWDYTDDFTRRNFTPDFLVPRRANIIAAIRLKTGPKSGPEKVDYSEIYQQ